MANKDHLAILKKGLEVWNKWREDHTLITTDLSAAKLSGVDLSNANLSWAGMSEARIIGAKLNGAILTGCRVFGISAWRLIGLEEAEQSNLVITPDDEPVITVDNLEVAQFIYLLLHSQKMRKCVISLMH